MVSKTQQTEREENKEQTNCKNYEQIIAIDYQ